MGQRVPPLFKSDADAIAWARRSIRRNQVMQGLCTGAAAIGLAFLLIAWLYG